MDGHCCTAALFPMWAFSLWQVFMQPFSSTCLCMSQINGWVDLFHETENYQHSFSLGPVLLSIIFLTTSLTAAMVQSYLQLCRNTLHGSALLLSEGVNQ